MLIIEGPDGAGKTNLARYLSDKLNWPRAERVVDKNTHALVDLKMWTNNNLGEGFQQVIFDRHRLLSDPIYRFILREKVMNWDLYNIEWLSNAMDEFWHGVKPLVIYCLPPLEVVQRNLVNDLDNQSVTPDIERIYAAYLAQACTSMALSEDAFIYDYTRDHRADVEHRVRRTLIKRGRL